MKSVYKLTAIVIPVIYLFFVFAHFYNGQPIEYDDGILINPLKNITSITDYMNARSNFLIWDVQPVRDFSYITDIKFNNFFSFWNLQRVNFSIWIGCYFLVIFTIDALFDFFNINKKYDWIIFGSGIFLIHPVLQLGPFWISSRKHILAAFFILLSTYFFLKIKNLTRPTFFEIFIVSLFYLLSIFSQPITILLPAAFFILLILRHPFKSLTTINLLIFLLILSFIFFVCLYLNHQFYNVTYIRMNGGVIYNYVADNVAQVRLLTLGRFFYQVFDFTMASPVEHDRGSIRNIIGLLAMPIFFYLSIKGVGKKITIFSFSWFMLPILVVILGDVKLFALDTYLLSSFIAILFILVVFFSRFKFNYFLYILYIPLLLETYGYSKAFKNGLEIARYAQTKEITSFGQYALATSLLYHGHFDEAFKESYALSKINSNFDHLNHLLPASLYGSKELSVNTKIRIFKSWPKNYFYTNFYHSLLYQIGSRNFHHYQYQALQNIDTAITMPELRKHVFESLIFIVLNCESTKKEYCKSHYKELKNKYFHFFKDTDYEFEIVTKLTRAINEKSWATSEKTYYHKINYILFYRNDRCSYYSF